MPEKKEHHEGKKEETHEAVHTEHAEHPISHHPKSKATPWMISTVVLIIIAVILLALVLRGTTPTVSKDSATQKTIELVKKAYSVDLKAVSSEEKEGVYVMNLLLGNNTLEMRATKDFSFIMLPTGEWIRVAELESTISQNNSNTNTTQTSTPAPTVLKSDKPVANFFVFAYCPYGTQMEKALVPAYNLLKNKADINIIFIGAMHGEYEHVESLRQLCIQKNYGKDKLFAYLDKFLVNAAIGNCQGTATCVNPLIESLYNQIGVDKNKINSCMTTDAEALYQADGQKAKSLGISGSPTVTLNGIELGGNTCNSDSNCNPGESCVVVDQKGNKQCMVTRAPESLKTSICNAFTTKPAECSQTLSVTSASAGFGSTASSSSASSCG